MKLKHILGVLLGIALTLTACNRSQQGPEMVAEDFLSAYLATDYQEAARYCHSDAASFLLESVEEFDQLPVEIKEEMRRQAAAITSSILSREDLSRDSVLITYCLRLDSLHHADGQMILTKNEDKQWRIQNW